MPAIMQVLSHAGQGIDMALWRMKDGPRLAIDERLGGTTALDVSKRYLALVVQSLSELRALRYC